MLIQIDPDFSNIDKNNKIHVPINNNNIKLNSAITYNNVELYFQTFGTSFPLKAIPISQKECIIIPTNANQINIENYFFGLTCHFSTNNKVSIITRYDHVNRILTVQENIFDFSFDNLLTDDSNLEEFYIDIEIQNPSFVKQDNLLCILGTDYSNISSNMMIENITQRWKAKIDHVSENYVLLETHGSSFANSNVDRYIIYHKNIDNLVSKEYKNEIPTLITMEDNPMSFGVELKENIEYAKSNHFIMLINKNDQNDVKYFHIKDIIDDIVFFTSDGSLDLTETLLLIIPYQESNSVMNINKQALRQKLFLKLKSVIFPRNFIKDTSNIKEPRCMPFFYLNVNSIKNSFFSSLDKDYTFIAFLSDENSICYQFKSNQIVQIDDNLKDYLSISFFNPNHESFSPSTNQILSFQNDDTGTGIKVFDPKNSVSIIFQLYV